MNRFIFSSLFCILIFGINSTFTFAQRVRFSFTPKKFGIESLSNLPRHLDMPGISLKDHSVDIISSADYYHQLKQQGYPVKLLEVQSKVDDQYLNPVEVVETIHKLKEDYPNIVNVKKIGTSFRGLPIYAVRISSPENVDLKPSILFNSMHHAREVMTPEVAVDIMHYLTENYQNPNTPWVRDWVDQLATWVVPQVNPDGNTIVWRSDSWWRKNAHGDQTQTWGVDLNRNYPYEWGKCRGSSGSQHSETYRGQSAGSEPETQAMINFEKEENFAIDVSYHSYSELVISPYGCKKTSTPEHFIVDSIGKKLASLLVTDSGRGSYEYGQPWQIIYPTDGDDISWLYHDLDTMAYIIEVNSSSEGFQPSYAKWRDVTVKNQRKGWSFLLMRLLQGPQVRGRFYDTVTGTPIDGSVRLQGIQYTDEKPRKSLHSVYYKLLTPGSYNLIFSAPGYQDQSVPITVDQHPTNWDVYLQPLVR